MFLLCPSLRFSKRISPVILTLSLGSILQGQTTTIRWGTHEGISSPLWEADWGTGPNYTDGIPSAVQTLRSLTGNLTNSSGGPGTGSSPTWSKGALVELGFFASVANTGVVAIIAVTAIADIKKPIFDLLFIFSSIIMICFFFCVRRGRLSSPCFSVTGVT